MDFEKFEEIFHHRNKLESQKYNECFRLLAANVEVVVQISLSWRFTLDSRAAFRSQYFKQWNKYYVGEWLPLFWPNFHSY